MQILAEAFVVGEHKCLIFLDGAAHRGAKLIPLKGRRGGAGIKVVARVKVVVAQKLVERTVPLVGARLRYDADLAARLLAVLGTVGVAQDVEFPHRVDAQQLPAGAAGSHVVFGCAGKLHAIQEKQVLLRAVSRNGEHISRRGIGDSDPAGFLPGEVHHSGIEEYQQVVATPVQGKIFDLLVADQSRNVRRRGTYDRRILVYDHSIAQLTQAQRQIHGGLLPHHKLNSRANFLREALFLDMNLVLAQG